MALTIYRIARWLHLRHVPWLPWLLKSVNRILFSVVLPPSVVLGEGVVLGYQGLGTVFHRDAVVGARVNIGSGVTIGGRAGRPGVAVVEEGAMIGAGAKILGPVRIGRCAAIGANAVVLHDIPAYAVAVGVPARVTRVNRPQDVPDYTVF